MKQALGCCRIRNEAAAFTWVWPHWATDCYPARLLMSNTQMPTSTKGEDGEWKVKWCKQSRRMNDNEIMRRELMIMNEKSKKMNWKYWWEGSDMRGTKRINKDLVRWRIRLIWKSKLGVYERLRERTVKSDNPTAWTKTCQMSLLS